MSKMIRNIQALSLVMQKAGVKAATVEYTGYGDSGEIYDHLIEWLDETNKADLPCIDVVVSRPFFQDGQVAKEETMVPMTFANALDDILWAAIAKSGNSGWENSDGGYGNLCIEANGKVTLEHTSNYTESESTCTEYEEPDAFGDIHQALTAALKATGKENITITYFGGGDSGEVSEIQFEGDLEALPRIPYMASAWEQDERGQWVSVPRQTEESFEDALQTLLWRVVDTSGHSGFENNSGGQGEMTLHADGKIVLDHSDNYENGDTEVYSWSVEELKAVAEEAVA